MNVLKVHPADNLLVALRELPRGAEIRLNGETLTLPRRVWVMAYENIPQNVSQSLIGLAESPVVILLVINLILLAVGTFMDMTPAVLIFTPIFLPIVSELGMDPTHFGIVMVLNLCVGLCTPPVGSVLFVGCGIADVPITQVVRPLMPLFVAMIVALMIITYVPALSLWLPRVFGF